MICAKNKEALSYLGIHPNLDRALESIKPDFLESLQDGVRVELDGIGFTAPGLPMRPSRWRRAFLRLTAAIWTFT